MPWYLRHMGALAIALVSGLAGVIVGSILTAILSFWLQQRSQAHDRAIAIFNLKADELRTVASQRDGMLDQFVKASEWCNHFVTVSPKVPDAYSASDKDELRRTIRSLEQRAQLMRIKYLTLSKPLLQAIWDYHITYSIAATNLEISMGSLKMEQHADDISAAEKTLQDALEHEVDRFLKGEDINLGTSQLPRFLQRARGDPKGS